MTRSSFLKSLFLVAASPKVLAEIQRAPKPVNSGVIFGDMRFANPDYMEMFVEKYGATDFIGILKATGSYPPYETFHHFEMPANELP